MSPAQGWRMLSAFKVLSCAGAYLVGANCDWSGHLAAEAEVLPMGLPEALSHPAHTDSGRSFPCVTISAAPPAESGLKSFLRVRPVYHFTERRIRAHIFLCVLGYLIEDHLRQRLLQAGAPYSARAALEALGPLQTSGHGGSRDGAWASCGTAPETVGVSSGARAHGRFAIPECTSKFSSPRNWRVQSSPLRVVTYDIPGVPLPIRACTRPTPEALAVASALGYTLPAPLPVSAAA